MKRSSEFNWAAHYPLRRMWRMWLSKLSCLVSIEIMMSTCYSICVRKSNVTITVEINIIIAGKINVVMIGKWTWLLCEQLRSKQRFLYLMRLLTYRDSHRGGRTGRSRYGEGTWTCCIPTMCPPFRPVPSAPLLCIPCAYLTTKRNF